MKESNIKRCSKPWNVHIDSEGSFVDVKDLFIYFKSEELHTHIYEDGLQSLTLLSKLKNEVQTAHGASTYCTLQLAWYFMTMVTICVLPHDFKRA